MSPALKLLKVTLARVIMSQRCDVSLRINDEGARVVFGPGEVEPLPRKLFTEMTRLLSELDRLDKKKLRFFDKVYYERAGRDEFWSIRLSSRSPDRLRKELETLSAAVAPEETERDENRRLVQALRARLRTE